MRERLLAKLAAIHVERPGFMAVLAVGITVLFGFYASQLAITMSWTDLLPEKDPRTVEYNRILSEFTSASSIVLVVQGEEDAMKKFADTIEPKLLALQDTSKNASARQRIAVLKKQLADTGLENSEREEISGMISDLQNDIDFHFVKRVDYKFNTDFIRNHSLMLTKKTDLETMLPVFTDPNLIPLIRHINDAMEAEYISDKSSLSTRIKEDNAVHFIHGLNGFISGLEQHVTGPPLSSDEIRSAADDLLLGDQYMLSYDRSALLVNIIPNFPALEIDKVVAGTDMIQALVDEHLELFPGLSAGLSGTIPLARDEMVYGAESANYTTLIAGLAVLILLMIALRMWIAPVFALINLFIGILWAIGITSIVIGQLNIMTQMMAVILVGLGIDFAIHIISGFTEWRNKGKSIPETLELTFLKNGKGVITGGITTACAFLTLMISSSRGMKEMGLVTGLGLLSVLIETFLVLPVFLVYREKRLEKKNGPASAGTSRRDITFGSLGTVARSIGNQWHFSLGFAAGLTVILFLTARNITFDQNYLNMEPKGLTSIALMDTIIDKFDLSTDYGLAVARSVEESAEFAEAFRTVPTAAMVDDISSYIPPREKQAARKPLIQKIRAAMERSSAANSLTNNDMKMLDSELKRLSWNVMELQDMAYLGGQDNVDAACRLLVGTPGKEDGPCRIDRVRSGLNANPVQVRRSLTVFQRALAPWVRQSVLNMASTSDITLDSLPPDIIQQYANTDTSLFLVTIFPESNMWSDMTFLRNFVKDMQSVTPRVTGMPPIFYTLIDIIGRDGRKALILTLAVVFMFLLADFRSVKDAFISMVPLVAGIIWMVGIMHWLGMQFTVLNVMALPLIVGIGIDDGVHIIHRWRTEGKGSIHTVFASTGKAVLLTTLTTMIAFGSLVFSIWRGFGSLGSALFIGVGACFLTTVLLLSALMGLSDGKQEDYLED